MYVLVWSCLVWLCPSAPLTFQVDTGRVVVLFAPGLWGLPASSALVCDAGEIAVQVVECYMPGPLSPTVLLSLVHNGTPHSAAVVHNQTMLGVSFMALAAPQF